MEVILTCIVGTYYVWHTEFPMAYRNVLEYLDHQIFGTKNNNQTVLKFIQLCDARNKIIEI